MATGRRCPTSLWQLVWLIYGRETLASTSQSSIKQLLRLLLHAVTLGFGLPKCSATYWENALPKDHSRGHLKGICMRRAPLMDATLLRGWGQPLNAPPVPLGTAPLFLFQRTPESRWPLNTWESESVATVRLAGFQRFNMHPLEHHRERPSTKTCILKFTLEMVA